ncbi:hypothetical protein L227DRAFT_568435 [Lentinus tigrinus ALCF2SS1-6]|uniref:Uncharacterized protein n=1 Tax=Lentinus tigrinus ALCF2SS1-6 TaxID=1328759 RepID=A0A5C2RQA2_9APHY|nr:hypothetical protein L227DRAFT_568435 [Lentinus tigrinus ALCF2SS1-6]
MIAYVIRGPSALLRGASSVPPKALSLAGAPPLPTLLPPRPTRSRPSRHSRAVCGLLLTDPATVSTADSAAVPVITRLSSCKTAQDTPPPATVVGARRMTKTPDAAGGLQDGRCALPPSHLLWCSLVLSMAPTRLVGAVEVDEPAARARSSRGGGGGVIPVGGCRYVPVTKDNRSVLIEQGSSAVNLLMI